VLENVRDYPSHTRVHENGSTGIVQLDAAELYAAADSDRRDRVGDVVERERDGLAGRDHGKAEELDDVFTHTGQANAAVHDVARTLACVFVGGLVAEELGVPADDVDRTPQIVREVTDGTG
jgi:hypothetical protein